MPITPEYRVKVSRRIRAKFENGRDHYAFREQTIRLPGAGVAYPEPTLLDWHHTNVFRA